MHSLVCGFILAVMALFPSSAGEGGLNLRAWMAQYEKYLFEQMAENFAREEQQREQETSEEAQEEVPVCETLCEVSEAETEAVQEVNTDTQIVDTQTVVTTPLYKVDGYVPDEGLQTHLYTRLCEAGIGWFHPYAICLIAQESTWNPMAENANNEDKGLLQYKIKFVPWMDWRNPYQQIDYFTAQMANRAAAGCTVSEMISRHNTSDYGSYNQSYVDAVMQHSNALVQIR